MSKQDSADKIDAAQKKYQESDKFKEAVKKYNDSDKGKKAHKTYADTVKGKLNWQRWAQSPEGQQYIKEHSNSANADRKLMNKIARWIERNPGKTFDDYFKEHPQTGG